MKFLKNLLTNSLILCLLILSVSATPPKIKILPKAKTNINKRIKVETLKTELPQININSQNSIGETLLNLACKNGDLNSVQVLLKDPEIYVNLPDIFGYSPLMTAIKHNYIEIIVLLLSYKYLNVNFGDSAPLKLAATLKNTEIIQLLLTHPRIKKLPL